VTEPRLGAPVELDDESAVEVALRPHRLADFVGQGAIQEQLRILLEAARGRTEALDHVLLYGPPGLGKTTLAQIIAAEMGVRARMTSGPAIEHQGMLASILTGLEEREVLFVDEVHRLARNVEESLYPAMEDFAFDWVAGKGAGAQALRLELKHFTVVGATTRPGALGGPLRDRFGVTFRLDFYDVHELTQIVERSAGLLGVRIDRAGAVLLAARARGTPRVVNRLLRRARDFAQVRADGHIDAAVATSALEVLGIDELGLDGMDRRLLETLCGALSGHPIGLQTMAVSLQEDADTVEDIIEPYLIRLGFLVRTPRGRLATAEAFRYLGRPVPVQAPGAGSAQGTLLDG